MTLQETTMQTLERHLPPRLQIEADWSVPGQYTMYDPAGVRWTVTEWLKAEISADYEQLVADINALNPSASIENYRCFLKFRHQFYTHLDPLYADPVILQMSLGASQLGRLTQIWQDMIDLGMGEIPSPKSSIALPGGLIQRLGWIFVAESMLLSSTELSSALRRLNLDADFGARHLARISGESGQQLEIFATGLDRFRMSENETERLYSGARSALTFANKLMRAAAEADANLVIERKK